MNTENAAILIIEDDADVQRAAHLVVQNHFQRVEMLSSTEGLEYVLTNATFDVVLLDMNFVVGERSGHAGLDALAKIRAFDQTLGVVLMTAYGGVSLAVDALKRGAADFILKPWRNERLTAAVEAAAALTRARRDDTLNLDEVERRAIERAMARYDGNVSQAAAALGLTRPALYRRLVKHGL